MNDYWNDPPEEQDYDDNPSMDAPEQNYDTMAEYFMEVNEICLERIERDIPERCPHGNEWGSCGHCDFLGDLAYDAAREKR